MGSPLLNQLMPLLKAALEANTLTAGYAAMVSGCSALPALPMIGNGCTHEQFAATAELHCPFTCGLCTLSEEGLAPRTCTNHTLGMADNKGAEGRDGFSDDLRSTTHLLGCFEDGNTYSDGGRSWEGFNASRRVADPSNTSTCECRDDPGYADPKMLMPCGSDASHWPHPNQSNFLGWGTRIWSFVAACQLT